ncbi:MAG: hypothetical protein C4547_05040 [Phycisphaerales bacterium]|nr:MAG: hypothetical protein C4547_05040 [Phycisphaerales bacterium]
MAMGGVVGDASPGVSAAHVVAPLRAQRALLWVVSGFVRRDCSRVRQRLTEKRAAVTIGSTNVSAIVDHSTSGRRTGEAGLLLWSTLVLHRHRLRIR